MMSLLIGYRKGALGMNNLVQKVSEYMQEHHMVEDGQKIVVGVSGGADSMGLLTVLSELAEYFHLSLVVVHVNHGVRGQSADADQSYVENVCREQEIPCYSFHVDLKRFAQKEGMSQEEAGRYYRYQCFEKVRKEVSAQRIAVAHQQEDTCETVLFNLFRGTGLKGLTGIPPVRDVIIRPLLCVSREDIEKYLQEIGKIHVLSPEEEADLAKKIRSGDRAAREKLVLSNLRFVVSVAKQYQNHGLTLGDLINEGNVGLIKAAECFDETKGFKFISYAVWWIRQSILQAIAENARLIRLPLNKISTINKVNRCYTLLEQEFQREPTEEEIAEKMDMTPEEVKENMKIATKPVSMDAPLTTDEESISLYDVYIAPDPSIQAPESSLNQDSLKTDIERSFAALSVREATILSMYYGLNGYSSMSLEEIGTKLGLTSERVRQVKTKAIRKLKEVKNNKRLKTYL